MADDNLIQAAIGALEGFNSAYVPYQKLKFDDALTRRRSQEQGQQDLLLHGQKLDMEEPYKKRMKTFETDEQIRAEQATIENKVKTPILKSKAMEIARQGGILPQNIEIIDDIAPSQRDATLDALAEERENKRIEREEKRALEIKGLQVPGYALDPSIKPSTEEAGKLRTAAARLDKFEKGIAEMKALVKEHGSFEAFGEESADMEGLATDLQLEAKELYNLGVLNGPDLMLISKTISDPSSLRSMFTKDKTRQKQLDRVLKQMRQSVESKMTTSGYKSLVPKSGGDRSGATLMEDGNGNRAYVYPDGRIEEIQ